MLYSNDIRFQEGIDHTKNGQYTSAITIFTGVIDNCLQVQNFCDIYVWSLYYRADAIYELLEYGSPIHSTFDLGHQALVDFSQFRMLAELFPEIRASEEYHRAEFAMAVIKCVFLNLPAEAYPVFNAWCKRCPGDKVAFYNRIVSATKIPGFEKEVLRMLDEYDKQYPDDTDFVDLRLKITSKVMCKYRKSKNRKMG